jgi:hypothetical protein
MVTAFMNQAATVFHEIQVGDGTTWRAVNGSGDAISASTLFVQDYAFVAKKNRLRLHTGTASTTWEVGVRLSPDRAAKS